MSSAIVIAIYNPKRRKDDEFKVLLGQHEALLREAGLVTDRPFTVATSKDGSILEIFEWKEADSAQKAHEHPKVGALWGQMAEIAIFPCLAELPEATNRFPHFSAM